MTVTLKNAKRVIGIKQVTKAVKNDLAKCVYIADDADDRPFLRIRDVQNKLLITIPVRTAIVKLEKVPIKTYSVVRISLALFNSPKRKTDFAANKKPTPSKLPTRTNVRIMILSM